MPTDHASAKAGSTDTRQAGASAGRTDGPVGALRPWRRSERGATGVEFAFILPVLLMVVAGIVQFGAIFFLQINMANAAREAARALALGTIETQGETAQMVERKLDDWGVTFTVDATLPDPGDPADADFTVVITAPLSEAAIFDYLGVFEGGTLRAAATMRDES